MLAKVEYLNPGGSVKDRIAPRMVEAAEASGELQPGGTIVEPTSGNTGVGLAMVAQAKGYHCIFVCPDKVSEDKRNVLKAYGAEVVVCPTAVAPEHPDSYYNVSDRLASRAAAPGSPTSTPTRTTRAPTTRPPARRSGSRPTARSPTSSPASAPAARSAAIGRYLKEQNPDVQVIGADPAGSVYSGGTGRPYLVEGVGEDFWPDAYDRDIADRIIEVSDADSFAFTRRLAREEALLVGGSSGMAAYAAMQLAARARRHARGRERGDRGAAARLRPRLPHQGLQRRVAGAVRLPVRRRSSATQTVGEVLRGKDGRLPDLVHTHPTRRSPRRCRSCRSTASRRCRWSAPSRRSWPPRSPVRSPSGPCSTPCSPATPG